MNFGGRIKMVEEYNMAPTFSHKHTRKKPHLYTE